MKIKTEVKVGLIAVITISIFVWGYNFMKGLNILKQLHNYTVLYDDIGGLQEANRVTLNGYRVGMINDIDLSDDHPGKIVVKIVLEKSFDLPENTIAEIYNADIMGSKAIRFKLGDSPINSKSGDTLTGSVASSLMDQMDPIKNKAENIMDSLDSILFTLQLTLGDDFSENFNSTLQHLRNSAQSLDSFLNDDNGQFPSIISNIDDITLGLKNDIEKFDGIMANMESFSDSLANSNIKTLVSNMNSSLQSIDELFIGINNGEGTIGSLVKNDSLYNNLEDLSHNLDLLLIDVKENPKRYAHFSIWGGDKSEKKEKKKNKTKE